MNEKEKLREIEFMKDLEDARDIADCLRREDQEFMSYAERCTKNWDACGKSVTPLI